MLVHKWSCQATVLLGDQGAKQTITGLRDGAMRSSITGIQVCEVQGLRPEVSLELNIQRSFIQLVLTPTDKVYELHLILVSWQAMN